MVPREFQALARRRSARARQLAEQFPAAREALHFYAAIAAFQEGLADCADVCEKREQLVELIKANGPEVLQTAASQFDDGECRAATEAYRSGADSTSPKSLFARVLLQPQFATSAPDERPHPDNRCPRCGEPPQAGCLRPQGDGAALRLVCSLSLHEWGFSRGQCPSCGESGQGKLIFYTAEQIPHLRLLVCETCGRYIHQVDLTKDPKAIPDVDEIAALPLDVWALERGYQKVHPNLIGI